LDRVIDLLIGLLRGNPDLVTRADRARDAREWELATRLYRKALNRAPLNPPIWVQYGHALKEAGELRDPEKLAGAELAYERALSLDPRTADTYLQLGHALKLQGKSKEAQAAYLRAFVLDSSTLDSLHELRLLGWSEAQEAELQGMLKNGSVRENYRPATEQSWSGHFDAEWYLKQNDDVARAGMDPLEHFLMYGMKEGRKPYAAAVTTGSWSPITDAAIHCLKEPSLRDEVALFAAYSPHGPLKPHVPHYLASLKRQGISVVLIVNTDRPYEAANLNFSSGIDGIFVRQALGYDYAAWAHVLRLHPELFDAQILYLLNDSVIGPTNAVTFSDLLRKLRSIDADLIGLTENFERGWHLQSYFLALKRRGLLSVALRKFIGDIVSYENKNDVINEYEIRLAPALKAAGLRCQSIFHTPDYHNPTSYHWKYLLQSGFPFIKVETIRGVIPTVDISDWRQLLEAQGYDVALAERTLAAFSALPTMAARGATSAEQQTRKGDILKADHRMAWRLSFKRKSQSLIERADHARDIGQWGHAVELYRRALNRNPGNPAIWIQYGHALKESGERKDPQKLAQAEVAYRRALSIDRGCADTYLQLGHVLKLQGKIDEAEASYVRAFALAPSIPYPLDELSDLGWSKSQMAELRGLISSDMPLASALLTNVGLTKSGSGRDQEAPAGAERPAADGSQRGGGFLNGETGHLLRSSQPREQADNTQPLPIKREMSDSDGLDNDVQVVGASGLFDEAYYRTNNPDVPLDLDPITHFLKWGAWEGRMPNRMFDPLFYLDQNPDVAQSGNNPLVHFIRHGAGEGRWPNPYFDPTFYLAKYSDVARAGRNPLEHFLKHGSMEGRKPTAASAKEIWMPETGKAQSGFREVTDAEIQCLKKPSFREEVALFATYSSDGRLKPHVPYYLDSLKRHSIGVILIVNADRPFTAIDTDIVSRADGIFVRENEGYDFAAWAHVFRLHPELFGATILYLLNDSMIGPMSDASFSDMVTKLRNSSAGFVGLTENFQRGWHVQTYFLALKRHALSSIVLQRFLKEIVSYKNIEDVINKYERRLASTLKVAGVDCDVMFQVRNSRSDPTVCFWKYLLQSSFPFVKVKTIAGVFAGVDIYGWREVVAARGYDVSIAERTLAGLAASTTAVSPSPLDAKRQLRTEAALELNAFFDEGVRLHLPNAKNPVVSILVVLFNEAELSLRCLRALIEAVDLPAEVIIVDNGSTDDTGRLLDRLDGARVIRNSEDRHFLRAVNQGSAEARGAALLLLNNDAQMMPGALAAALDTLQNASDIGAVGGKLLLPDGTLQEAGSIIWNDGSCAGYGRGQDPDVSEYQFRREVDYCSGAFLLIRRDLFEKLGRLDDSFAPAYYEETDFCMRLRQAGYRVVYDPRIEVLHYEFATSSLEEAGVLMRRNHSLFYDHHWRQLAKHHLPPGSPILFARMSDRRCPRLLVIDDLVPYPYHGAGFPRASRILKALHKAGCFITHYPVNQPEMAWKEVYTAFPIETEFMLGHGRVSLSEFLNDRTRYYDVIVVSRPHNMESFLKHFEEHPDQFYGVSIIYDAEALFSEREAIRLAIAGTPMTAEQKEIQLRNEIDLARAADAVITVSTKDASEFKAAGYSNVHVVGHALEPEPIGADFADRQNFLFVGAFPDDWSQNTDGLFWFIEEVMPCLDRLLDDSYRVYVAGPSGSQRLHDLINPRIAVLGRVEDLTEHYRRARVFIAPTRFAAGIPHKVHEAAARGLPTVATSLLGTQLGWDDDAELLIGDAPEDFAAQCARLYTNRALWYRLREAALVKVAADCDPVIFDKKLTVVLQSVGVYPRR
jgi:GT2 family glycosyltransferase/lipopolysaccharide biosynthesis protein/Tfp pilus assembly protein PilF